MPAVIPRPDVCGYRAEQFTVVGAARVAAWCGAELNTARDVREWSILVPIGGANTQEAHLGDWIVAVRAGVFEVLTCEVFHAKYIVQC